MKIITVTTEYLEEIIGTLTTIANVFESEAEEVEQYMHSPEFAVVEIYTSEVKARAAKIMGVVDKIKQYLTE